MQINQSLNRLFVLPPRMKLNLKSRRLNYTPWILQHILETDLNDVSIPVWAVIKIIISNYGFKKCVQKLTLR